MLKISDLKESDIGRWVFYYDGFKFESGRIKSWNDQFVFVVYSCDGQWDRFQEYTACATNPEDLGFSLTLDMLKTMEPHAIIATGMANDDPQGLFMANTNQQLRWVAVRGGIHDWTIYCHFAYHDIGWIMRQGDKVCIIDHIKKLVPCDDEALAMYRY